MEIPQQRQQLIDLFLDRNSKINLSAIRDPKWVYVKHILDSLELMNHVTLEAGKTIVDVWTGGGFPLLPLASINPEVTFTGIDARKKKVGVINEMISSLWLTNAQAVWTRAEEHKTQYDIATARAVAYADVLLPRLLPLVKPGGDIYLYKMRTTEENAMIHELELTMPFEICERYMYTLPWLDDQRVIYHLQKNTR